MAVVLAACVAPCLGQSKAPSSAAHCGEVVTLQTHGRTTTRYAGPPGVPAPGQIALVLLVGGGGHLDLDAGGCPRALTGNSLVRSVRLFHDQGFVTALVDAPSDHPGEDGLAGFRVEAPHAKDIGRVITDLRGRGNTGVWLVGTSRGTISAVNAASRPSPPAAPDGVVLTSVLTVGSQSRPRPWVRLTVFDLKLDAIRVPLLMIGHAADLCLRSPAALMRDVATRTRSARQQTVTVTGGPGNPVGAQSSIEACEGRTPHGFVGQEAEVAAGI
ncbi:MAG TPA: hypothetical protein VFX28_22040, partial [Methylomirabilota bacterium]|nr:hypothetical protein [Methylomirabilota bacterium]